MSRFDFAFSLPDPDRWRELACHEPLALLTDFDGTLVERASSYDQVLHHATSEVLQALVDHEVLVAIVSGRPRTALDPYRNQIRGAWWIAEHGAWANTDGEWQPPSVVAPELDDLEATFELLARPAGGWTERKSLSVCLHWRSVPPARRPALVAAAELACEEWLEEHHDFERVPGIELVEVRRRGVQKGLAVQRVRAHLGGARVIAIGDDLTDEDMFAALVPGDASLAVGSHGLRSRAHAQLANPSAVTGFLRWLLDARRGDTKAAPPVGPIVEMRPARERSLVVISNRTPTTMIGRQREVGGLVSALEPALHDGKGIWLGWSGREREGSRNLNIDAFARPPHATFDLTPVWREKFHANFCNRVLWPLFHGSSTRVTYNTEDWNAYEAANAAYAGHALELARPDATIWVHDYHLLLVARELRRRGHAGPLGMFLHIPFPSRDLLETLPWCGELLDAMLAFDLVGFHTGRWASAFIEAVRHLPGVTVDGHAIHRAGRTTRVGTFPIGIDPAPFMLATEDSPDVAGLRASLGERRLLLGVDRLDYSKGIPERLAAFERLLEQQPEWRGRISFVQVSVPSRAEIPDYVELKHRVETMVGRINGRYGEADWVPVRYLYRSYDHVVLAQLYRLADIAVVTPLRDGMNLVAKEFVAAQSPESPGVLVLSRFAGAAAELTDAILTNPSHPDGLAADLARALRMPREERVERHARLLACVQRTTPQSWARDFLTALTASPSRTAPLPEAPTIRHFLDAKPDRSS